MAVAVERNVHVICIHRGNGGLSSYDSTCSMISLLFVVGARITTFAQSESRLRRNAVLIVANSRGAVTWVTP
jgi:hypothetical protein